MARFYNTSQTNFVDYEDLGGGRTSGGVGAYESPFGELNSLPQDRARLQQIVGAYEGEINDIVSQLQANPRAMRTLEPRIASLRQRYMTDMQAGELKAIQDRYNRDIENRKQLTTALKDDPFQLNQALQEYERGITPIQYDPTTGMFNNVEPQSYASPFTDAERNKWFSTYVPKISETVIEQIKGEEGLDRFTQLYERGDLVGVAKERALQILAQQVTPQMIQAENQRRRLMGDTSVDESTFFQDGRPNLNTSLGRMVEAAAESVSRQIRDTQFIKDEDEAGIARMRGNENLREARGRARIEDRDANQWAERMAALWRGQGFDNPAGSGQWSVGSTDFMRGMTTRDGFIVKSVERERGSGRPLVVLERPAKAGTQADPVGVEAATRVEPLNIDFLSQVEQFNPSTIAKIDIALEAEPEYSRTQQRLANPAPTQRYTEPEEPQPRRRAQSQQEQPRRRRAPGIKYD